MENKTEQTSNEQLEYMQNIVKRMEAQRNDALNNVALLETELMKAQKIINEYKSASSDKVEDKN